jgi:hypothetical protein
MKTILSVTSIANFIVNELNYFIKKKGATTMTIKRPLSLRLTYLRYARDVKAYEKDVVSVKQEIRPSKEIESTLRSDPVLASSRLKASWPLELSVVPHPIHRLPTFGDYDLSITATQLPPTPLRANTASALTPVSR